MSKTSENRTTNIIKKDDKGIKRKQEELMNVLQLKNFQLQSGNLSYLEYVELREELLRLNALKDFFAKIADATEKEN